MSYFTDSLAKRPPRQTSVQSNYKSPGVHEKLLDRSIETRSDLSSLSTKKQYVAKNAKANIIKQLEQSNMDLEYIIDQVEQELEIYYQERRNFVRSEGDTYTGSLLDDRLIKDVRLKETTKRIKDAKNQKELLEKKKKKLQSKVLVMPKSEEIRAVTDKIKMVAGEIDAIKKEIAMKQKAIKFMKQGSSELPINDSVVVQKNQDIKQQIQQLRKQYTGLKQQFTSQTALNKQVARSVVDETIRKRQLSKQAKETSKARGSMQYRSVSVDGNSQERVVTLADSDNEYGVGGFERPLQSSMSQSDNKPRPEPKINSQIRPSNVVLKSPAEKPPRATIQIHRQQAESKDKIVVDSYKHSSAKDEPIQQLDKQIMILNKVAIQAKRKHQALQTTHGAKMAALKDEEEVLKSEISKITASNAVQREELNDLQFLQIQEESQLQQSPQYKKGTKAQPGLRGKNNSQSFAPLNQGQYNDSQANSGTSPQSSYGLYAKNRVSDFRIRKGASVIGGRKDRYSKRNPKSGALSRSVDHL